MTGYLQFAIIHFDESKINATKFKSTKQKQQKTGDPRRFLKKAANVIKSIPNKKKLVVFTALLFVVSPKVVYALEDLWTPEQLLIEQFKLEFYIDKIRKLTLKIAKFLSSTPTVKEVEELMNLKVDLMELKKFSLELALKIARQKELQKIVLERNYCSTTFRHKVGSIICRTLFKLRIIAVSNDDSIILGPFLKISLIVLLIGFEGYILFFGRSSTPAAAPRQRLIYHTIGHQIYKVTLSTD